MMYNKLYINKSNIKKNLSQLNFNTMQIINYVLILIENALVIYLYYRDSWPEDDTENTIEQVLLNKNILDIVIVCVILIKLLLFIFVLFIFFYLRFTLTYQRNIIFSGKSNFIFRKLGDST